uniref:Uncharacterized protein n=1 Tax=Romanomermis culicivorax TaxID=13658 RepID=A0A915L1P1_ROMCU
MYSVSGERRILSNYQRTPKLLLKNDHFAQLKARHYEDQKFSLKLYADPTASLPLFANFNRFRKVDHQNL